MEKCLAPGVIIYSLWLIPVMYFDITSRRIPDILSFGCFISLLALTALSGCRPWFLPLLSAAAASGFLLLMRNLTARSIGIGDIKFTASSGVLLPGILWLPALCIASFSALLLFLPLYVIRRIDRRFRVPFAPFIGLGTIAAALLSSAGCMPPGF